MVIVGAGAAGLACAQRLIRAAAANRGGSATPRLRVTVLEGRSRVGGRTHSTRSLAVPVDLGAAWLHGLVGNVAYTLQEASLWRLSKKDDLSVAMYAGAW